MMKRILTGALAASMVVGAASLTTFAAANSYTLDVDHTNLTAYDKDEELISDTAKVNFSTATSGALTIDPLQPGQTIYVPLDLSTGDYAFPASFGAAVTIDGINYGTGKVIKEADLGNSKLYSVSLKKTEGSKLISKVEVVSEKSIKGYDGGGRHSFLKITVNDNTSVDENKFKGTLEIKAKKTSHTATNKQGDYTAGTIIESGDKVLIPLSFWVSNQKVDGDDYDAETGDRIVFNPSNNEKNTIVWGDDRAALYFEANDDASKFYARLSTKSNSAVYAKYGDPQDADLWFYDFVGNPTVPATSRATLTLGIPWDDDASYVPNVADCHIYELNADGTLTEVKSFTYDDDNDSTTGIEGWSIKTRQLGTYVLSDKELDLDEVASKAPSSSTADTSGTVSAPVVNSTASIPNTGSSDVVNVAVVAAIVSLAAAGAVAFRKVK